MLRLSGLRIVAQSNVICIGFRCADDQFPKVRVLFHKRWHKVIKDSQHIVADEDLAVAVWSSTDADGRYLESIRYSMCNIVRNRFEDDRKGSGILQCQRIFEQFLRRFLVSRLSPHSSQAMYVLGSQPN